MNTSKHKPVKAPQNHIAAPHRPVDLLHDPDDFKCALLASLGFSTKAIMARTILSSGQITYRLHKGQIKRMEYRNGTSAIAKDVLKSHTDIAEPILLRQLRKVLKEQGEH